MPGAGASIDGAERRRETREAAPSPARGDRRWDSAMTTRRNGPPVRWF